jgi:hypothetical protein
MQRCNSGEHTFDDSQHSSCPFCRKTRLATASHGGVLDASREGSPKTRVVFSGGGEAADLNEAVPVVGQLVIINATNMGQSSGQNISIKSGMNRIGREKGDILIKDSTVAREEHARLAYDPDDNSFWFAHKEGRSLSKVNGQVLLGTRKLKPHDHIRIGTVEMIFELVDPIDDIRKDTDKSPMLYTSPQPINDKQLEPNESGSQKNLEAEYSSLEIGKILFNPPETMKVGKRERIEARISMNLYEELHHALRGSGAPQEEIIKVGHLMTVRMSGDGFTINPLNGEGQVITNSEYTGWSWDVTPQKSGNQTLHLHVTVRLRLPFGEERKDHPVMEREIKVKIRPFYSVSVFIAKYWQWIIGTLLIPLIGFAWAFFKP